MADKNEVPKVYAAIAAITEALGKAGIAKARQSGAEAGSRAPKFAYRGIDDVYAALNPLLGLHNLVILPRIVERTVTERKSSSGGALFDVVVKAEFDFVSSEDGSMHTVVTYGEAMDSSDKATNKSMSVAFKYAAFMAFSIPTEGDDNDPDAVVHNVAPQSEKAAPKTDREAEARAEFERAGKLMDAATTIERIDVIWKSEIDWTKIPRGWTEQVKKLSQDAEDRIRKAPAAVPPKFDESDRVPF